MADLTSYIRDLLTKGYKVNDIRNYLIQYGHKAEDIDYAIAVIYQRVPEQTPVIEHHHKVSLSKNTILTLVIMTFLFVGGLSLIVKEFWLPQQGPGQLLDVQTSSTMSVIDVGDELKFNVEIFNLGGENRYDILLEHALINSKGNVVNQKSETIALETRASIQSSIMILDSLSSDNYIVKTVAKYNGQVAEASFMIGVQGDEPIPTTTTVEGATTTFSSITTTQIGSTTTVTETTQGESCFDNEINQDEEGIDCGGVCGPCTKSDVQITKDLNKIDLEIEKEAYCLELEDSKKRDACFIKVAFSTTNSRYCGELQDSKRQDDCFMWFITSYEFDMDGQLICDLLENKQYKETCFLLYENFY